MRISIQEKKGVFDYLQSRNILKQYKKAKDSIISGDLSRVDFKIRQPKESGIYQFRITKKYRAFAVFHKERKNFLVVYKISDHQ